MIEQQPVFATVRQDVQGKPDLPEKGLRCLQLAQLAARQKAVIDELIERVCIEVTLRYPADRLDIAQAAGARLDVRFEVVGCVMVAMMTRRLLRDLGFEEVLGGPHALRRQCAPHRFEQGLGAGEQPRLDHRGRDADIGRAFTLAIIDSPHAVTDFEANVPHEGEKAFEVRLPGR